MTATPPVPKGTLLVLYTQALEDCRLFYEGLGLTFQRERHEAGPEHYAAVLPDGMVIELYPATKERVTSALRLGFAVDGAALEPPLPPGRHLVKDPEGRTVELHVIRPEDIMTTPSAETTPPICRQQPDQQQGKGRGR